MNTLSLEKKILILNSLVEGNSIRSTEHLIGVTKKAITKLLVKAGERAKEILDTQMVGIQSKYVQADEIFCYVGKKQKRCTKEEKKAGELGDQYVFVAMDAEIKLFSTFKVGKRTVETTRTFIKDLQYKLFYYGMLVRLKRVAFQIYQNRALS